MHMAHHDIGKFHIGSMVSVEITDTHVYVTYEDGLIVGNPFSRWDWLEVSTPEQRSNFTYDQSVISWPNLGKTLHSTSMFPYYEEF